MTLVLALAAAGCRHDLERGLGARDAHGRDLDGGDLGGGDLGGGDLGVDLRDGPATDASLSRTRVWTDELVLTGKFVHTVQYPAGFDAQADLASSFVLCTFRAGNNAVEASLAASVPACHLTGSGLVVETGNGAAGVVRWQLVRTDDATVQRGSVLFDVATPEVSRTLATPVTLNKSFVLASSVTKALTPSDDANRTVTATLSAANGVVFARADSAAQTTTYYQVVTLSSATVHRGAVAMTTKFASVTIPPVAPERSFVILSVAATSGDEATYMVRAELAKATNLVLTRSNIAANVRVAWFVVELGVGSNAQHGAFVDATVQPPGAALQPFDGGRSFVLLSTMPQFSSESAIDSASYIASLSDTPPSLTITRTDPDTSARKCDVSYSVVEFAP